MPHSVQTSKNSAGNGHDSVAHGEAQLSNGAADRQPLVEPVPQVAAAQAAVTTQAAAPAQSLEALGGQANVQASSQPSPVKTAEQLLEDDLVTQLKDRLAEADRQFRLYTQAQEELERLRLEVAQLKAQSDAAIAQAERDKNEAVEALTALKERIRGIVSDT